MINNDCAWRMIGYDRQRTSRMNAVGNIKEPRIAWQMDMSASEYFLSAIPECCNTEETFLSSNSQTMPIDDWRKFGLAPLQLDILGNNQPVDPPAAPGARWGKFLPDAKGLQRLSWTNTWGEDSHFQMHSFDNGLDQPELVWDIHFDKGVYSPLVVVMDIDGDNALEAALSTWHGVIVYDIITGNEKYRCMYRGEHGRQYGFFGAYADPDEKAYLVVIGDFAGHIGVLSVNEGELKNLWVHQFDTQSIQGIDRRFTINTVGPDPVGDFDGDGHGEILMNVFNESEDGRWHLIAYSIETGEHKLDLLDTYLKGHVDVDGDGIDELLTQRCDKRPVGTNGELSIFRWNDVIWTHPYARWSMYTLAELPITRITGAMRGMESPVSANIEGKNSIFYTESGECLNACSIDPDGRSNILWNARCSPGGLIDAAGAHDDCALICIRAKGDIKAYSDGVRLETLATRRLLRDAPQPLIIQGKKRTQIIAAEPLDVICSWIVSDSKLLPLWRQQGRAMTTNSPQMLGLLAGDIDRDGVDEVICVQEAHEGHSRLAALNLDGNVCWCYDFPDFNGRAPVWNETGTTIWALGHFTDPEQLDIMVSNRRSIMHSDETVLLNIEEKTQVWHRDILEVREPWTDTPWKHTRGYGGGVVAIADFDGDGLDDIALCYPAEYSIVKGINGEQYALESTGPLKGTNNFWVIGGYPMAVDLNGDGKMDTLWVSQSIIIAFAPRETCTDILWHTEPGDGASGTPAYGDSDGDGYPEIGLPGFKDGFRCIAPASGNTLYTVPQYGDGASNCVAIDINNDGLEEFLYANGSCLLAVAQRKENLDPFIWKLELPSAIKNLALGDVDNDGNIEILASGTDGIIYCVK